MKNRLTITFLNYRQMLNDNGYDLFATVRQCGGAHTLTLPHKKTIKVPQQIIEEQTPVPPVSAPTARYNMNESK